jgi:hypothetical protein
MIPACWFKANPPPLSISNITEKYIINNLFVPVLQATLLIESGGGYRRRDLNPHEVSLKGF